MSFSPIDCSYSITRIDITSETLEIVLNDGRIIPVQRSAFKRISNATDAQLAEWRIDRLGIGIHWESIDEDLLIYPLIEEAEQRGTIKYLHAS